MNPEEQKAVGSSMVVDVASNPQVVGHGPIPVPALIIPPGNANPVAAQAAPADPFNQLLAVEQQKLMSFTDNANVPQAFCYLATVAKYRFEAVRASDLESMAKFGTIAQLREILRTCDVESIRSAIKILGLPRMNITGASFSGLITKRFKDLKAFVIHLSSRMLLPQERYCDSEFMQQLLSGKKRFLPTGNVRYVKMPKIDELKFKVVSEKWGLYPLSAIFLPDRVGTKKAYDRAFFFNVLNTVYPNSMTNLLKKLQIRIEKKIISQDNDEDISNEMRDIIMDMPVLPAGITSTLAKKSKSKFSTVHINDYEVEEICYGASFRVSSRDANNH